MLVSGVQQRDSVIHICVFFFPESSPFSLIIKYSVPRTLGCLFHTAARIVTAVEVWDPPARRQPRAVRAVASSPKIPPAEASQGCPEQ